MVIIFLREPPEKLDRNLLQELNAGKAIGIEPVFWHLQYIPTGIHEQFTQSIFGDIEIIPAFLSFILFKLKIYLIHVQEAQMPWMKLGFFLISNCFSAPGSHGLNARIPVRNYGIALYVFRNRAKSGHGTIAFEVIFQAVFLVFWSQDFQLFAKINRDVHGDAYFHSSLIAGQTFFSQILSESFHEVGFNAENVQSFKLLDICGLCNSIDVPATLQTPTIAFEPHATPEELYDLRSFAFANVHQPHCADTPTVPTFDEFL